MLFGWLDRRRQRAQERRRQHLRQLWQDLWQALTTRDFQAALRCLDELALLDGGAAVSLYRLFTLRRLQRDTEARQIDSKTANLIGKEMKQAVAERLRGLGVLHEEDPEWVWLRQTPIPPKVVAQSEAAPPASLQPSGTFPSAAALPASGTGPFVHAGPEPLAVEPHELLLWSSVMLKHRKQAEHPSFAALVRLDLADLALSRLDLQRARQILDSFHPPAEHQQRWASLDAKLRRLEQPPPADPLDGIPQTEQPEAQPEELQASKGRRSVEQLLGRLPPILEQREVERLQSLLMASPLEDADPEVHFLEDVFQGRLEVALRRLPDDALERWMLTGLYWYQRGQREKAEPLLAEGFRRMFPEWLDDPWRFWPLPLGPLSPPPDQTIEGKTNRQFSLVVVPEGLQSIDAELLTSMESVQNWLHVLEHLAEAAQQIELRAAAYLYCALYAEHPMKTKDWRCFLSESGLAPTIEEGQKLLYGCAPFLVSCLWPSTESGSMEHTITLANLLSQVRDSETDWAAIEVQCRELLHAIKGQWNKFPVLFVTDLARRRQGRSGPLKTLESLSIESMTPKEIWQWLKDDNGRSLPAEQLLESLGIAPMTNEALRFLRTEFPLTPELEARIGAFSEELPLEERWFLLAEEAFSCGNCRDAACCLAITLTHHPDHAEAWFKLGVVLDRKGQHEKALRCNSRALDLQPNDARAWFNLGVELYRLGQLENALRAYGTALDLRPKDVHTWFSIGVILTRQDKCEKALRAYGTALDLRPDDAGAWGNLGAVLGRLEQRETELHCHAIALVLQPDDAMAWWNLGVVLAQQDQRKNEQLCYATALCLQPDFAKAWYNLGGELDRNEHNEKKQCCYVTTLCLQPSLAHAWCNLGVALCRQEQHVKEQHCYTSTLCLQPDFVNAWSNLGVELGRQGQRGNALGCLAAAVWLKSDNLSVWIKLAKAAALVGNIPKALHCWKKAWLLDLRNGPAGREVARLLERDGQSQDAEFVRGLLEKLHEGKLSWERLRLLDLLAGGKVREAREEIDALRDDSDPLAEELLPPSELDFLEGLVLVQEGRYADALRMLERLHRQEAEALPWEAWLHLYLLQWQQRGCMSAGAVLEGWQAELESRLQAADAQDGSLDEEDIEFWLDVLRVSRQSELDRVQHVLDLLEQSPPEVQAANQKLLESLRRMRDELGKVERSERQTRSDLLDEAVAELKVPPPTLEQMARAWAAAASKALLSEHAEKLLPRLNGRFDALFRKIVWLQPPAGVEQSVLRIADEPVRERLLIADRLVRGVEQVDDEVCRRVAVLTLCLAVEQAWRTTLFHWTESPQQPELEDWAKMLRLADEREPVQDERLEAVLGRLRAEDPERLVLSVEYREALLRMTGELLPQVLDAQASVGSVEVAVCWRRVLYNLGGTAGRRDDGLLPRFYRVFWPGGIDEEVRRDERMAL